MTGTPRSKRSTARSFGSEVIQLLIPHRPPFLLVDRVLSYSLGETPTLTACRFISANEPVFAGHFPGWAVWPGVYTIEGMGQSGMLLAVLDKVARAIRQRGQDEDALAASLRNLELGYRLRPEHRQGLSEETLRAAAQLGTVVGLGSKFNIKLLEPVFAGQRLDYSVEIARRMGEAKHFEVEATVDGRTVARGSLGSSSVEGLPGLR